MSDLYLYDSGDLVGAGLGWRRADDDWPPNEHRNNLTWLAPSPPKRRERRPTLESQLRQLFRAACAAGVPITVTIEGAGAKLTATPAQGNAAPREAPNEESPRRSLFQTRANPKQKVVL
jgi:hypothetical protein